MCSEILKNKKVMSSGKFVVLHQKIDNERSQGTHSSLQNFISGCAVNNFQGHGKGGWIIKLRE